MVPADETSLPGMKTVSANTEEKNNASYFPNIEYVKRGDTALHLQLILPEGIPRDAVVKKIPAGRLCAGGSLGRTGDVLQSAPDR